MKPDILKKYYIRNYEEFYRFLNNRLHSISKNSSTQIRGSLKTILLVKLNTVYNMLINELDKIIEALSIVDNMHVFYREIFKLETNSDPRTLIKVFKRLKNSVKKIYLEYRVLVRESSGRETSIYFKTGLARLLSIYRRKRRIIESIKNSINEMCKLPDITGNYIVIIAGMPQVGKSTLLSKLTRAKPEISPFPFTTKTVIVGHIDIDNIGKITLIDTPGLLDRPVDYKNVIELKAVLALKYLADTVLYILDTSSLSYYSLSEQLNVLDSIYKLVESKEIIVLINKVDITPSDQINKVAEIVFNKYRIRAIPVSAHTGYNLDYVKKILIEKYIDRIK